MRIRQALGFDGAVAYTFAARSVNIVGSTGTVLLIVRFLGPVQQGYYYTLLSLVSLQMVFELGFSFVIQQLAAHECTQLEIKTDGSINGDRVAHGRLASTLRLSLHWYTMAAAAMGLILAPLGMVFFAHHAATEAAQVAWRGPWLTAVFASMAGLWCMPFYSFLEGCGQVRAVAAMRLRQAIAACVLAWAAMLLTPRALCADYGHRRPNRNWAAFCGHAPAAVAGAVAPLGPRNPFTVGPRGLAIPMADRCQLDVLLLHCPDLHSYPICVARFG